MSLSESLNAQTIRELRHEIEEVTRLLSEAEPKLKKSNAVLREQTQLLTAALALTRRMGLPDNVDGAIAKVQRFIFLAIQLRLALLSIQAAAGPYGWALALISGAATILTAEDAVSSLAGP